MGAWSTLFRNGDRFELRRTAKSSCLCADIECRVGFTPYEEAGGDVYKVFQMAANPPQFPLSLSESVDMVAFVSALLQPEPRNRLGMDSTTGFHAIRTHPWYVYTCAS